MNEKINSSEHKADITMQVLKLMVGMTLGDGLEVISAVEGELFSQLCEGDDDSVSKLSAQCRQNALKFYYEEMHDEKE
ncbi:MAG: hypothetical protein WCS21_07820 [Lachnospiraceae bacterium]